MCTFNASKALFVYNSDFSGRVAIHNDSGRVVEVDGLSLIDFLCECYIKPRLSRVLEEIDLTKLAVVRLTETKEDR